MKKNKKEYLKAAVISIIVLFLVNCPLLYFSAVPKEGLVYLGRRVTNSQDLSTYLSFVEQARQGKWLLQNLYTNEPQIATLIRPSYVVIGKFAAMTHLSSLVSFELFRVLFSLIFCALLYKFISVFIKRSADRLIAFGLFLTASGLGWLLSDIVAKSSDLWIPESNPFLSLAESPHFISSQIIILIAVLLFFQYLKKRTFKWAALTVVCFIFLTFEHPFDVIVLAPAMFLTLITSGSGIINSILVSGASALGLLYPLLELRLNPLFAAEQAQGASPSPAPTNFLFGFGLIVPFAVWGAEKFLSLKKTHLKFILLWTAIGVVLLYSPVSFQRRISESLLIPIPLLASIGFLEFIAYLKKHSGQLAKLAIPLTILLLSLSSFRSIITDFTTINKDTKGSYYYYIAKSDYDGINWLGQNTDSHAVILGNWFYGNMVPGFIGRTVYVGHTAQTIDFDQRVKNINIFLLNTDTSSALKFLTDNRIVYIFLGQGDTMLRFGFKPDEKPYLKKVFDENGTYVYQVIEVSSARQ